MNQSAKTSLTVTVGLIFLITSAIVVAAVFAAELVSVEVVASTPNAIIEVQQGGTVNFNIQLTATGAIGSTFTASNPNKAAVNTYYSVSGSTGSSSTPSGWYDFYSSGTGCSSGGTVNCDVTWTSAPNPYVVAAQAHADAGATVGDYQIRIAATFDNPSGSGGKMGDTTADNLVIRVTAAPTDTTPPVITHTITGTLGLNGWYTSDVTVTWTVTDPESTVTIDSGCGAQTFTSETTGVTSSCSAHSAGGSASDSVTLKIDMTGPSASLSVTAGTLGSNGWYTSDVTVHTSGSDSISEPVTCTADQSQTAETTGAVFQGSCTNYAGLTTNAAPLTVKLDKTGPSASLSVTVGTAGAHGWYTSDVTVSTTGSDDISGPVSCTADQYQTTETTGTEFQGSCTNYAGLSTDATSLTVKLDKTGPSASLSVTVGTLGLHGWYTSDVTVSTTGSDSISGPVSCTADQPQTAETTGTVFQGSCTNDAGLTTNADPLTVKLDKTAPVITITSPSNGATYILNAAQASDYGCNDPTSGVASCTGTVTSGQNFDTSSVGPKGFTVTATDVAGNTAPLTNTYNVQYAVGTMCLGSPSHQILQPINPDGTSVFKQGSTVPAKFRVCDANGVSIGTAGVISSFRLVKTVSGTTTTVQNEAVDSTTPDTAFRWDPTSQQWIFNMNSKKLLANTTYFYEITLNDGTKITFSFGLK